MFVFLKNQSVTFCFFFFFFLFVIARRKNSLDAKHFFSSTNIQWRTPSNDYTEPSVAYSWYRNSNDNVSTVAGLIGPQNCMNIGIDIKAKVGMGYITVKQTSMFHFILLLYFLFTFTSLKAKICMNAQKLLITPDHNFSCYKIFDYKPGYNPGSEDVIDNSGALKIVVRPAYWTKEHAYHTAIDLEEMLLEPKYFKWTRVPTVNTTTGKVTYLNDKIKPVLIIRTDNAMNYSPKCAKVQHVMLYLFKLNFSSFIYIMSVYHFPFSFCIQNISQKISIRCNLLDYIMSKAIKIQQN